MISGFDITISTPPDSDAIADGLRTIGQVWPHAVVESADAGESPVALSEFRPEGTSELFVYRDATSAVAWERDGVNPELVHSMIHFLQEDGEFTVVVADPNHPETAAILSAIRATLGFGEVPTPLAEGDSRRAG